MISKYMKKKTLKKNTLMIKIGVLGLLIGVGLMVGYCQLMVDTQPAIIDCFDKAEIGEHGMTEEESSWFKYGAYSAAKDYTEDCEEDLLSKKKEYDKLNTFYEDLKSRTK